MLSVAGRVASPGDTTSGAELGSVSECASANASSSGDLAAGAECAGAPGRPARMRFRKSCTVSPVPRPASLVPPPARASTRRRRRASVGRLARSASRSEEHTSELQSRLHLVCRLLLEKKKKTKIEVKDHRI